MFEIARGGGNVLDFNRYNQRWYETPNGYVYAPFVQPVKHIVNEPWQAYRSTLTAPRVCGWRSLNLWSAWSYKPASNTSSWIPRDSGMARLILQPGLLGFEFAPGEWQNGILLSEKYGAPDVTTGTQAPAVR